MTYKSLFIMEDVGEVNLAPIALDVVKQRYLSEGTDYQFKDVVTESV